METKTYSNQKSAKKAAKRDASRLPQHILILDIEYPQVDDRFGVRVVLDHSPSEVNSDDLKPVDGFEVAFARKDAMVRRRRGEINSQPHTTAYPARAGSIQAQMIEMLAHGATLGDLQRVCKTKAGKTWNDNSIRSACYWDIGQKGYGVRTEWMSGWELWKNCSFDDMTDFQQFEIAYEHPDEHDTEQALHDAIAKGYNPANDLHPVYFLVLPEGMSDFVPHKMPKTLEA